jgi:hypothetical protein
MGKKQMEIEILQAAQEVVKKSPWLRKGSAREVKLYLAVIVLYLSAC